MKELKAMVSLPYVRPDGKLVDIPGFDEVTGVYADFPVDAMPRVPDTPTLAELEEAIKILWKPWSGYRFATDNDRAGMFAAIVTAICRPALTTSPGFFFDAPVQASGKTKCAGALGALIRCRRGGVSPFVDGIGAEAETVKKLVSMLMAGEEFWLIDNVVGVWRSPVIASFLTDGVINERVLGGNSWYRGEARIMICATGNNGTLDRDLGRRFIRVRIDPGVETPQARSFAFDPVDTALSERMSIARAVLVVVRAFWNAGAPRLGRGDAGFTEWSRLVRDLVLWLGKNGIARCAGVGQLGDPAHSILEEAGTDDPDTTAYRMLLQGLAQEFLGETFQAKDVVGRAQLGEGSSDEGLSLIYESLSALLPGRKDIAAVSVGKVLRFRRDRIAGGLVLRQRGIDRNGVTLWAVELASAGGAGLAGDEYSRKEN